ncbi:MAG TPA: patatin-like phospholipase family protein [Burkholderiaceae bacterium]|nr:patatin-like phospholipase family protein [Burkholderiaceae bacterium]
MAASSPTIGFALGSGALHGWAHIGIVRGCVRIGLQPFAIAGSNVGAAIGALWAAGLPVDEIVRITHRFEWQTSGALSLLVGARRRNDALREEIDRGVRGRAIADLPVRFAAVASDANSGESVILDAGPVDLAVEASCAAPAVNDPVPIGKHQLLDGSLTAPVPVSAVRKLGAQRVVAVDVAYRPHEAALSSSSDYAFQAVHILTNTLAREQTRAAEHLIKLDVHHLMRKRLDVDALIDAGEAALMKLAPLLLQK